MGYDAAIVALKKKALYDIQKVLPEYSFRDLYSDYLFATLYSNEYDFSKDEEGRWICCPRVDIFNEFFGDDFGNDEARIIDKDTYFKFYNWLEEKLKCTTLFEWIDKDMTYAETLIDTYKSIRDTPINFETEFIVFEHDW